MEKAARVCGAGKRDTLKPIGVEAATSDGNKARRILSALCGVQIPAASTKAPSCWSRGAVQIKQTIRGHCVSVATRGIW